MSWPRAVFVLLVAGCTDADLYGTAGGEPLAPDRVALAGKLCTADASGRNFPVKVLFVIDESADMWRADPDGFRFSGANGIEGVRARYLTLPHVYLGFLGYSEFPRILPQPDGQRFFRPQDMEVDTALSQMRAAPTNNFRDVVAALNSVESFINKDIDRSPPGEVLRTRYLVTFLTAGPPTNSDTAEDFGRRTDALTQRIYSKGVLEFRINTNMLHYGPNTITAPPGGFGCYAGNQPGDPPCACGGASGPSQYCGVYCSLGAINWDQRLNNARRAYDALSFPTGGRFMEHPCAGGVSFNVAIAQSAVRLVKKDILAYNRNVLLGPGGPMVDSDADGLADGVERGAPRPTNPLHWDHDDDGISDKVEAFADPRQDPLDPSDRPPACGDRALGIVDRDGDLLNDCEEGLLSSSLTIPDTDGDGLPDYIEFLGGTTWDSADDRLLDTDGDGIGNGEEVLAHTDPHTNDNLMRGTEGYRSTIDRLGLQQVPVMEEPEQLQGITFRRAHPNVLPGQAYLLWNGCSNTLSWSDASFSTPGRQFLPQPQQIGRSGVYTLYATAENGEQVWVEIYVTREFMPPCAVGDVIARPLLSKPERYCYDVRLSNIKVMATESAMTFPGGQREAGVNSIMVFFTQAPESRLASPGLTRVAEYSVHFRCTDPNDITTCSRSPSEPTIEMLDTDFVPR